MATTGAESAVFVDTNVLVHADAVDSVLHMRAKALLRRASESGRAAWISRQILREYLAVATRPQAFATPLTLEEAATRARDFACRFTIAEDGPEVTARLFELVAKHRVRGRQVHDANIVATMLAHGVGRLLTLNPADFRRFEPAIAVEAG